MSYSNFENGFGVQVREWELGPNSTIYDNSRAAPSDQAVYERWIAFIVVILVSLLFMIAVFVAILKDKKCRKNVFNTYLLFLLPPDILSETLCAVNCAMNLSKGTFFSISSCKFQSFYLVFAVTSSSWLNAIVAYQLHSLLTYSHRAMRYHAPTRQRVAQQALMVYAWSAFLGSWTMWGEHSWWPVSPGLYGGNYCLPMAYDTKSLIFLYAVYSPCVFMIPFGYICYASIDIWRRGLLPPPEKRQNFMVFLRIVTIYFVIYIPTLAMILVAGYWSGTLVTFIGGMWAHLQGPVSAATCLVKPDVMKSFKNLLCCRSAEEELEAPSTINIAQSSEIKKDSSRTSWLHQSAQSFFFSSRDEDAEVDVADEESPPDDAPPKE